MAKGFKIGPDVYRRGNGRWAKVSNKFRQNDGGWFTEYALAYGIEGNVHAEDVSVFRLKKNAVFFAEEYIKEGRMA